MRDRNPDGNVACPDSGEGSGQRYRSLFEEAPVAYHEIDSNGVVIRVNHAECALLGYEGEEIVGRPVWELVDAEERRASQEAVRRKISGEQPLAPFERTYRTRDGRQIAVEIHERLIHDAAGEVVGIRSCLLDITDRKNAQAALRLSEERYRDLLENANDMVFTHDWEGNVTAVNRTTEHVTGYARAELIGMNLSELLTAESIETLEKMKVRKLAGERTGAYEVSICTKSGARVIVEVNSRLISDGQKPVEFQSIGRDLTERKAAEQRLREYTQEIEQKNADLAATLAALRDKWSQMRPS